MKENHKKILSVLSYFLVAIMSVSLFIVFMNNKVYHKPNDAFYYQSIADSLRQTGQFRDITHIPSMPIRTPQNGIVLIQYILSWFSISPEQRLIIIVLINYAALLCSVFPLLKIARRFGLSTLPVRVALTAAYLCGWHIIRCYLLPVNDAIFVSGSLWLIYYIILLVENNSGFRELLRSRKLLFPAAVILSILLIHFRVNAIAIPLAAMFAVILTKRYKLLIPMSLLAVVMFLSIMALFILCDTTGFQSVSDRALKSLINKWPAHIWNLAIKSVPGVLFQNMGTAGNMLYIPFLLALLATFFDGVRKKEFVLVFIVLICVFTFIFLIGFFCIPYRYLLLVYPLLYIILFRKPAFRSIGYLFVFALVTNSLMWCFYTGIGDQARSERTRLWSFVSENVDIDKSDYILINLKNHGRYAYYYAGLRTSNDYDNYSQVFNKDKIYLAGPRSFLTQEFKKINDAAEKEGYSVSHINLTENFQDDNGNAFWEIQITRP